MSRGKHSASAALRRAEAAHEHIDRLTDQLVEAKARARRFEADSVALPQARAEIERLRADLAAATSVEVRSLRHQLEEVTARADRAEAFAAAVREGWQKVLGHLADINGGGMRGLEAITALLGEEDGAPVLIVHDGAERKFADRHGVEALKRLRAARGEAPAVMA